MLDLLIRGGTVVDGTGAPRRVADVGIRDGKIVAVGKVDDTARQLVAAEGKIVAPSPSPLHGVTTVIGGNCGFSVAPLNREAAPYLTRMLARVEGMPLGSLEQGVPWDRSTTASYLNRLEARLSVNAGFMVGHSTIRRVVMGEAGAERQATQGELAGIVALLRHGLDAGGLGLSSTAAETHNDGEGRPVPSRHAAHDEFLALAAACGDYPGTSLEFLPSASTPFPEDGMELTARMSAVARRPLNWNVLHPTARTENECLQKLAMSDRALGMGGTVVGLAMPVSEPTRFNFLSGFVLDALPGWGAEMARPFHEKLRLLADPGYRRRLDEMAHRPSGLLHLADWGAKQITEAFTPATSRYTGRTVAEVAQSEGKDPFDALLDIVCADRLRTTFSIPRPDDPDDWEARLRIWRDPRVVLGASDAGAHLDMASGFIYTSRLLQTAVRDKHLLDLEEAVHMLTARPAALYGLTGRGRLAEGLAADLVVFDEATVGCGPVHTRHDLPGGNARLYAEATGIDHVLVNGEEIVTEGKFTAARPGAILRSGVDTWTAAMATNGQ